VGAAEDGNTTHYRPQAAGTKPDDAVDDATIVCLPDLVVSQWSGSVLGDVKCYYYCYPILCYWLGGLGFNNG